MSGYDVNDHPSADQDFPDCGQCETCGARLDDQRNGPGAFICWRCIQVPPDAHKYEGDGNRREPSCKHCGRGYFEAIHRRTNGDDAA